MLNNIDYKLFVPEFQTNYNNINEKDIWLIFNNKKLMVKLLNNEVLLPHNEDIKKLDLKLSDVIAIGDLDGKKIIIAELSQNATDDDGFIFHDFRSLVGSLPEGMFLICSRAFHIMNWNNNNRFCSRCGTKIESDKNKMVKICSKCGLETYPRISPAIIVAVVRENKLLLAHNINFPPDRYSVIAGFVDPGETFEQCVMREVREEIGIKVKNIKYFGSQPWPFPDSLMIGFTAEHESGEIKVDGVEIGNAKWFDVSELPNNPRGSIARRLIDWFVNNYAK